MAGISRGLVKELVCAVGILGGAYSLDASGNSQGVSFMYGQTKELADGVFLTYSGLTRDKKSIVWTVHEGSNCRRLVRPVDGIIQCGQRRYEVRIATPDTVALERFVETAKDFSEN